MENQKRPHALMIPVPLQGHVNPFVHLAIKLASNGFTITFVNTQSIHQTITKSQPAAAGDGDGDIFAGARESGLDIRYATISDGFPLGFDRFLNHDQFIEGMLHVFSAHVDDLVGNMVDGSSSDPPLTCLIADGFYVWPSFIANKYNLVNVSFWTEPALVFTLYYHIHLLKSNGHFASLDNREDTIDYIPGVGVIEARDLPSYLQDTDIWTPLHRLTYKAFEDVRKADLIICNTVQELELETIPALQQNQPFYAIGPIFPTGFAVGTNLWSESDCTHWLESKPRGSVLYVSFGSLFHASKHDILEIAHGLLLSQVSFVWVLRRDSVDPNATDSLPVGFVEDVKDKGLIVPWCCQIDVISHPAIGGFLTHCGWNSILESIWCNVPMLCFPLMTDQLTNRKLVVDDWRVGLNLCRPITMEEVTENINRLMSGKSADELRKTMKKVKGTLKNALGSDGSSYKNLKQFIENVKVKIQQKHGLGS